MNEKDFLTGCLTKESIDSTLDRVRAQSSYGKTPFSIMVIDLDRFKEYNDKYGHMDGDEVLRYFSSTLRLSIREEDGFIFRFGGDEFVVVFPEKTAEQTYLIALEIIKVFRGRPFLSRGKMIKLSFSGGIASYPVDGEETDVILERADKAMYFSKTHGRGRVTLYRSIFLKRFGRSLLIFVSALLLAGIIVYIQQSPFIKGYVTKWFRSGVKQAKTTLASIPAKTYVEKEYYDIIHLKSGRVLKGTIKRDGENEIDVDLNIDQGVGSVTIQKSDINSISKVLKEGGPAK